MHVPLGYPCQLLLCIVLGSVFHSRILPVLLLPALEFLLFANPKVDQAVKEYRSELEDARKQVMKTYEAELKKALGDKDLDGANAIKLQMENWEKSELEKIPEMGEVQADTGDKPDKSKDQVEKKWTILEKELVNQEWRVQVDSGYFYSYNHVRFGKDGTVDVYVPDGGTKHCKWKIKGTQMGLFTEGENGKMNLWALFVYLPSNKSWVSTKAMFNGDKLRFRPI